MRDFKKRPTALARARKSTCARTERADARQPSRPHSIRVDKPAVHQHGRQRVRASTRFGLWLRGAGGSARRCERIAQMAELSCEAVGEGGNVVGTADSAEEHALRRGSAEPARESVTPFHVCVGWRGDNMARQRGALTIQARESSGRACT
jgi:hypothetical protein